MASHPSPVTRHRIIALIGANGMLATAIQKLAPAEYRIQPYDLPDFDLTDRAQVLSLREDAPDIIINCAAFTNVDGCEEQDELAMRVNGEGPGLLAELAKEVGAVLVHISTDFVFDGSKGSPYLEDDRPQPLSVYGKSKLFGEQQILKTGLSKYFIVRTSWLYGAGGNNFVETMIRLAKEKPELKVVADQRGTPTWTEDLATAIFALLNLTSHSSPVTRHSLYGLYHFSNSGECSWYEFACEIVAHLKRCGEKVVTRQIVPINTEEYPLPATRPHFSVLSKQKFLDVTGAEIPSWQESLSTYFNKGRQKRAHAEAQRT